MPLLPVLLRLPLVAVLLSASLVGAGNLATPVQDPWDKEALIEPAALAEVLGDRAHPRPIVIYVGFPSLYNGAHIQNSVMAGPDSKPEGLDQLRQVVKLVPKNKEIVIYCGCCPFDHCPNIRPAYSYLKGMGFTRITVVHIPTNLHTDWVAKGYPTTKGPGL